MMIRIQQKNDEGHSDYISNETDDNDDAPSAFIAPSASARQDFPATPECDQSLISLITPG